MKKMLAGALIVIAGVFLLSASRVMAQLPCTADFDCSQTVDADDVAEFLNQFGRSPYNDPCPDCYDSPCPCTAPGCDPPAPLRKTGQTTLYALNDDGDLERGIPWPNPRFTDNGDGTVTDNLTGLIWMEYANCFGLTNWNQAILNCNTLANGVCGLTDGSSVGDWVLPNVLELQSVCHYGYYNPSVPNTSGTGQWTEGDPFIFVQSDYYWSSTTVANNAPGWSWGVNVSEGILHYGNKVTYLMYVWCVRDPL